MAIWWGRGGKALCFHSCFITGEIQVQVQSSSLRLLCGGVEITFHIYQTGIHVCVGVCKCVFKEMPGAVFLCLC